MTTIPNDISVSKLDAKQAFEGLTAQEKLYALGVARASWEVSLQHPRLWYLAISKTYGHDRGMTSNQYSHIVILYVAGRQDLSFPVFLRGPGDLLHPSVGSGHTVVP